MTPRKDDVEKMKCSICEADFDIEAGEGVCGHLGILPVSFCVWCYSGVMDLSEKTKCQRCPCKKTAIKNRNREQSIRAEYESKISEARKVLEESKKHKELCAEDNTDIDKALEILK